MAANKGAFLQVWPKCFIIFMAIIVLLSALILIFTEICNVGANFWTTNVFAGGWCGLVMLVFAIALSVTSCCSPGPSAAFRAVIIAVIGILATGCLIGFDAVFIAQPSTCILTPSCSSNAAQTNTWSYYLSQSFFTIFNGLSTFKTYTQSQTKFLFQAIQLGVGCLCFVLCLVYMIIYYVCSSKAKRGQVSPGPEQQPYPGQYQNPAPAYRPNPRAPQANPGEVPWNVRGRY